MNKKLIASLFILSVALFMGCKDSTKIGYSIGEISSERMSQESFILENEIDSLGATPLMEYAYRGTNEQLQQANNLIDDGVSVLVVFPTDSNDWNSLVSKAHDKNVKVIAYENLLQYADVDYFFSFDNQEVGRQQAEYAVAHRPKGNYILIEGPDYDYNSMLYLYGQMNVLQPYIDRGDINVLYERNLDNWDALDAYIEMQTFLEKNKNVKIDAIIAANDQLASGCIKALDHMLGDWDILITGQDATVTGLQNILDGKQSMTVYKSFKDLATITADEAVINIAKGGDPEGVNNSINNGLKDVPSVLLKTTVVDTTNIRQTVIADGFVREDQLTFP